MRSSCGSGRNPRAKVSTTSRGYCARFDLLDDAGAGKLGGKVAHCAFGAEGCLQLLQRVAVEDESCSTWPSWPSGGTGTSLSVSDDAGGVADGFEPEGVLRLDGAVRSAAQFLVDQASRRRRRA